MVLTDTVPRIWNLDFGFFEISYHELLTDTVKSPEVFKNIFSPEGRGGIKERKELFGRGLSHLKFSDRIHWIF
jgi:hypothetical protein